MTTKNACESLQRSDVKKKRIKRDTQEWTNIDPEKGGIISWKEMFIDINSIDFKAPFCFFSEK